MPLLTTPEKQDRFTAPPFTLPGTDGRTYAFEDVRGEKGTLILFICNHCPYVKAVIGRLAADLRALADEEVGAAAIMPNDTRAYPADSFENMKVFAREHDLPCPYLIDETQNIARAYGAVCTPDIFGFDAAGLLQYRGRVDSAGPNPADGATRREMLEAMRAVARTGSVPAPQFPSMGCSIKWRG